MAFGSGSFLATDRWRRRRGFPSSLQVFKVGNASRLHQHSSSKPTAQVSGLASATSISRSRRLFSFVQGIGEVIHLFALSHPTPRRRESVARMVSPETRLSVSPSSKAACAAISRVQRLDSRPNSLGERWSISLSASALFSSKAAYTRLGRDEPAVRESSPRSLKAWMAFLAVCEPHPRLRAIFGGESPRALARRIWQRRRTKASLERSPASSLSRSLFDSCRTKIGGFMEGTIAHLTHNPL